MFNPYLSSITSVLEPVSVQPGLASGLLERLKNLDSDDLLLLLIILLLMKDGKQGSVWPMAAALIYLVL